MRRGSAVPATVRPLLVSLLLMHRVVCEGEQYRLAPWFVWEPPSTVQFAARDGVRVRCAARGDPPPALLWLHADGTPIQDAPGLRRVYRNGTLEVLGTSGETEELVVRCRADNAHGVALSRDVRLQPVREGRWEVESAGGVSVAGGVAAVSCRATQQAQFVKPALWYKDDRVIDVASPTPDSRILVAGEVLLIKEARASDAGQYACVARHQLTRTTKRSSPALLTVTATSVRSAPRLLTTAANEFTVQAGADLCMPCVSSDHPPPHYTWYRELDGRLQPVERTAEVWLWGGGAALCVTRARRELTGAWLCKAYNVFGDATAQLRLTVADTLSVTVAPTLVVASAGSTVRLNCSASDASASLVWLHDAAAAGAGTDLVLRDFSRHQRGLYQCVARRGTDSAQASAEVRLGDSPPELHYTFIEQALRPGGDVSLRCAASGAPAPHFTWLLDGTPLDARRPPRRVAVAETVAPAGDVLAVLNVTAVAPQDGGRYTCRAHNRLGHAEHSARLNIYGPPSIRVLGPVRVVAGANATIFCPYAGYPISSISWWRRGASVAVGGSGRVAARGAELRLAPALAVDAGHYACAVAAPPPAPAAPPPPAARRDIEIQVRNPPKISPFIFSSELTEGSSVQVLCGVSSGDKPMYFSWLKDSQPLPPNLQIEEKSLNEFSLLMFSELTAQHSGDYTCRVSNHAATVNYTATLSVKVAPAWSIEPVDAAILLGAPIRLECAAKGYPTPIITWYRKIVTDEGENEQWQPVSAAWGGAGEGGAARARGGALLAAAAARAHQGVYRCTADNGVGPPLLNHVNLTIHEPAHFENTSGNVSCIRGHVAALSCHARGDAPLAVHWTHRGARIDLNSYRWTVSEVRTAEGLRSTLQLRAAERSDSGEYRCHANNRYGRSEILMHLSVEEPPLAPRDVRLRGVGARWVRVAWRALVSPPLVYIALVAPLDAPAPPAPTTHLHYNLTLDPVADKSPDPEDLVTVSALIDGLRPAAAYSVRLAALNHIGESPHSDPLMFNTLEEVPAVAPQNVRVRPGNPNELHVSWSAPPKDGWNGELLGYVVTWREVEASSVSRLTSHGWSSAELTVSGLASGARYAVTLRAFNTAGAGPPAPTLFATTAQGAPEVRPASVSCEALSSRSLRVRWTQPPTNEAYSLRGFDVFYTPFHLSSSVGEARTVRAGAGGEATLQALLANTNYSVWVRARADAGLGPPATPVFCATHEDIPSRIETVRALAAGDDAVRVTWLAPTPLTGRITHYTLHTRELGKNGGEWSQRVEAANEEEIWREVRGLRAAVYEVWVRAHSAAGAGPGSRPLTAAPAVPVSARISSISRAIYAAWGTRVRLRCAAVGTPPIRWQWSPLPQAHTVTDSGDLIIHKVESHAGGNYTCYVRNPGGSDATVVTLIVVFPPAAPAPRLMRAETHVLHVAWEVAISTVAPVLGYTVSWSREEVPADTESGAGAVRLPAVDTTLALRRLACGASYRIVVRAENAIGTSPPSRPLFARTKGDKAKAAPGKEFVWANSSSLRVNLLTWRARCPVVAWRVAVRRAARPAPAWLHLDTDGETAQANNLKPGTWYDVSVIAYSPAGETVALYRAATHTLTGGRLGEAVEVPAEARTSPDDITSDVGAGKEVRGIWHGGSTTPALLAAALVALLGAVVAAVMLRRRTRLCVLRRECEPQHACQPHPQLYTTEPGKRNGKSLTPPDGDLHEISPYATFSMANGTDGTMRGAGGCALHLHTFGRAESMDLAAPPPRPNLIGQYTEYRSRDSDSESSGSPCAVCAAELYRLPGAHLAGTLPAPGTTATTTTVESSADDTSYSGGGGRRAPPAPAPAPAPAATRRGRRRRDHLRHNSGLEATNRSPPALPLSTLRRTATVDSTKTPGYEFTRN